MGACCAHLCNYINEKLGYNSYKPLPTVEKPESGTGLLPREPSQASNSSTYQNGEYKKGTLSQAIEISKPLPSSNGTATSLPKSGFYIEYELKDEIGVGSTSKCYRCYRKSDGMEFACKVIDKRQVEAKFNGLLDQFFVEIKVLKTLNHPNIIHLEDTFETPDRIYIVMEMMNGGELFDYVVEKGTLSEEEASLIIRKITSAVAHMHGLNIIHRDLKPENLLLTSKGPDAEVKLIDFGLAKEMSDAVARSFLGTRGYLAPEMLQRHSYDKAIDIWALGIIAFVLLCGCLPFDDDSSRISSDSAVRKKFTLRFPRWAASLSASAKDLLHNLLDVNPKTRYTAEQALNHPWVSGRSVQPHNYLQSPSMLGERRNELRSPALSMTQQQHQQQLQLQQQQQQSNTKATRNISKAPNLDPIKEEHQGANGAVPSRVAKNYANFNNYTSTYSGATGGIVRKNSI